MKHVVKRSRFIFLLKRFGEVVDVRVFWIYSCETSLLHDGMEVMEGGDGRRLYRALGWVLFYGVGVLGGGWDCFDVMSYIYILSRGGFLSFVALFICLFESSLACSCKYSAHEIIYQYIYIYITTSPPLPSQASSNGGKEKHTTSSPSHTS